MATKLRNITTSTVFKTVLFILITVYAFAEIQLLWRIAAYFEQTHIPPDCMIVKNFSQFQGYSYFSTNYDITQSEWNTASYFYLYHTIAILALAALLLLFLVLLTVSAGRKRTDRELHLLRVDAVWTELTLFLWGFSIFLTLLMFASVFSYNHFYEIFLQNTGLQQLLSAGIALGVLIFTALYLSLVRKLKAKRFIKTSLTFGILYHVYRVLRAFANWCRDFFDATKHEKYPLTKALFHTSVIFIASSAGLLFLCMILSIMSRGLFFLILYPFLEIVLIVWFLRGNQNTYHKINAGMNESLEEQMKAERTKTALITNVSHDLKTPLTSIITYIDLLSREEISDTARDYVQILGQKSERLKHIVSDLFDLSKSAAGAIPLELENLDLKRLVEQTVADMRDAIDTSGLNFKIRLPDHAVNIYTDGKKLYRVFQNIISNALKYSLENSRIYLDMSADAKTAVVTLKNTAAYEMNFAPDEILQRFFRGDSARSGEGSGLGLSIAESFTKACGGDFKLDIDGDLFKVTLVFDIFEVTEV